METITEREKYSRYLQSHVSCYWHATQLMPHATAIPFSHIKSSCHLHAIYIACLVQFQVTNHMPQATPIKLITCQLYAISMLSINATCHCHATHNMPLPCHSSHATCHSSHATYHVTNHMLLTCHSSHAIAMSLNSCHMPLITCHCHVTHLMPHAIHHMPLPRHSSHVIAMQLITCHSSHATHHMPLPFHLSHATCHSSHAIAMPLITCHCHATHHIPHATHQMPHATHHMLPSLTKKLIVLRRNFWG